MKSWLRICALLVLLASSAQAAEKEIRIGVLSFRSLEQSKLQWQATADYLNTQMAGFHFSIIPMYYTNLDLAINRHELDFVLTNPEYYTTLHADHALSAIATLMPLVNGNPVSTFGGVILARADRADINSLADVRGKVVASPNEHSLGGYLMERWALYKQGIMISQIAHIQFTDMPHDKAVLEVLNGTADVAFVRTGILEGMAHDGSIRIDQFKVLNRQPLARFPQLLSTDLYPEWPFAAMPNVPDELVKRVTLNLLMIQPRSLAARQGNYFGFSPPGNYAKVEAVMERLKVDPERKHQFSLRDVASKYGFELISGALLLLLTVLTVAIYLARTNRNLQKSYRERERLDSELQQINATLEDKVARRTRELRESETRFRRMFEHHASPMLLIEPVGGGIVNANHAAAEFYGYSIEQMAVMNIGQINVQPEQLTSGSMLQAQQEKRNFFTFHHRLANGEICTVEVHSSPVEVEGRSLLFSIIHDITERNQLEAKMHDLAFYDPLTRLPNRRLLVDRLNRALISAARNRQHGALMFLDLDHFKVLNDLHGHDIGDQMLVEVARRILSCIRSQDSAARFGGDEFVVMLEELSKNQHDAKKQAGDIAEKIRRLLAQPYLLQRGEDVIMHHCSSSIGVTVFLDHEGSLEQLLKRSDMAMYRAKDAGRNVIRFFDPDMQFEIETGAALEADLHSALAQQEFRLFYQVQVNILGKPHGAEVLLRWQHPGRGLVSPDQFIPLAEGAGLIVPIGEWVLDTACTQIKLWEDDVLLSNLVIAVNVSAKQFRHPDFVGLVKKIVLQHDIRPELLKLELTESLVLEDIEDTIAKMKELKALGLIFSMDDFGTGYSSLSHLKRLPLDQIKIDQSFVRDITTDKNDLVMVNTIVDLGMNFEMEVIAEGVETQAQLELLQRAGCISFQGYLFSKPVPLKEFETLLKRLYDA